MQLKPQIYQVKLEQEAMQQQRIHDAKPIVCRIENVQICTFLQIVQN